MTASTWDNDEHVDYTLEADHWQPGGGPQGNWPEHNRIALVCTVHGRLASYPPKYGLLEAVFDAERHHHDEHGGACYDWCGPGISRCGASRPAVPGGGTTALSGAE